MEYKHTVTVSEGHWLIRFYCWAWDANKSKVDFCRLFWGYFPPFLLLNLWARLVLYPFFVIVNMIQMGFVGIQEHRKEQKRSIQEAMAELGITPKEKKPNPLVVWGGNFAGWVKEHDIAVLLCAYLPLSILAMTINALFASPPPRGQQYGFAERATSRGAVSLPVGLTFFAVEISTFAFLAWRLKNPRPLKPPPRRDGEEDPFAFRALTKTAHGLQWGWFHFTQFANWLWPKVRWPLYVMSAGTLIVGIGVGLWFGLPPAWSFLEHSWLELLEGIGIVIGSITVAVGFGLGLRHLERRDRKRFRETKVGSGFYLLWRGAVAFKSNTCPKIELTRD